MNIKQEEKKILQKELTIFDQFYSLKRQHIRKINDFNKKSMKQHMEWICRKK